jgi:cysteine desulfurase family protein
VEAGRLVFETREQLAALFGIIDSSRIIFTSNATEAINLALFGLLIPDDVVAVSAMEHNAVMRPLRQLQERQGVSVRTIHCDTQGTLSIDSMEDILRDGVKLVAINHASNVTGTIAPLAAIARCVKKYGALLLLDAAQTAGICPINVKDTAIDLLAFSGHKSLYGPQGTGGLYIREGLDVKPLTFGGTGSNSESDEQPFFLPDRFESGTLNGPGIAGLGAGVAFVRKRGVETIFRHGCALKARLIEGLRTIDGINLFGPAKIEESLSTVSFRVNGTDPAVVAQRLNDDFDIYTRVGLHCAPQAHRTIRTFPQGTVRIAPGFFNTESDMDNIIAAVKEVCRRLKEA